MPAGGYDAVFRRGATEGPEGFLQARGQGNEALASCKTAWACCRLENTRTTWQGAPGRGDSRSLTLVGAPDGPALITVSRDRASHPFVGNLAAHIRNPQTRGAITALSRNL
jgi:hypothetical protein